MRWPSLDPGSLRHKVQVQYQSDSTDEVGQPVQVWHTLFSTYASIKALRAREVYQSGQITSQAPYTITMRWVNISLSAGMRVYFGTRVFGIQSVNNVDEMNTVLELVCQELNGPSVTSYPS